MAAAPLPAPPRRSALLRLVQPLLDLVVRERAAGGPSADMLWATDAAASVLLALLTCVRSGRLALGDADALRLLSAAPVVLRVQPQALVQRLESVAGQQQAQVLLANQYVDAGSRHGGGKCGAPRVGQQVLHAV